MRTNKEQERFAPDLPIRSCTTDERDRFVTIPIAKQTFVPGRASKNVGSQ
jgi:hypothetical protein